MAGSAPKIWVGSTEGPPAIKEGWDLPSVKESAFTRGDECFNVQRSRAWSKLKLEQLSGSRQGVRTKDD
jgi:hypothetical protein